jgi:hypothetical protein
MKKIPYRTACRQSDMEKNTTKMRIKFAIKE